MDTEPPLKRPRLGSTSANELRLQVRLDLLEDAGYWFHCHLGALEDAVTMAGGTPVRITTLWHTCAGHQAEECSLELDASRGIQCFWHPPDCAPRILWEMAEVGSLLPGFQAVQQPRVRRPDDRGSPSVWLPLFPLLPLLLYRLIRARPPSPLSAGGNAADGVSLFVRFGAAPTPAAALCGSRRYPNVFLDIGVVPGPQAPRAVRALARQWRCAQPEAQALVVSSACGCLAVDVVYNAATRVMLRECFDRRPGGSGCGVVSLVLRMREPWPALTAELGDLATLLHVNPLRHLCVVMERETLEPAERLPLALLELFLGLAGGLVGVGGSKENAGLELHLVPEPLPCVGLQRSDAEVHHEVWLPPDAMMAYATVLKHGFRPNLQLPARPITTTGHRL